MNVCLTDDAVEVDDVAACWAGLVALFNEATPVSTAEDTDVTGLEILLFDDTENEGGFFSAEFGNDPAAATAGEPLGVLDALGILLTRSGEVPELVGMGMATDAHT